MDIWLELQFLNGNKKTVTSSKYLVTLEMAGYFLTNYSIHEFGSSEYKDKDKEKELETLMNEQQQQQQQQQQRGKQNE
jgi:hypothetical protein